MADLKPRLRRDYISRISEAVKSRSLYQVWHMIASLPAAGIAHVLQSSPPKIRREIWRLMDRRTAGEVLQYLNDELRNEYLTALNAEEVVELTGGLEADDLADILQQLPESFTREVLDAMDQQDRQRVESVLPYAKDSAGGLMNVDTITVRPSHTLELVLRYLRRHDNLPDMTDNILVVDRADKLLGILPLGKILTSDPQTRVRAVMRTEVDALPVAMAADEVARLFQQHGWVSAPVVNERGKLLGRITIDDVVAIISDSTEHPLMSMAGLDEEDDTFAPVFKTARRRALWLGVNLSSAVFASFVIFQFQETLDKLVYLAVLMPIVANMGGVAGTQTLTLVIRNLALGHIAPANSRWFALRELGVGALNGMLWAVAIAIISYVWYGDPLLSAIIAAAVMINLITAALAGTYLPLVLKRLRIDPALAGSVAVIAVTDSMGFFAFLGLAQGFYL